MIGMTRYAPPAIVFLFVIVCTLGWTAAPVPIGLSIARAAAAQVGTTVSYDPSYRRLPYPGGDVPLDRGVCSDVVVRAFRAIGVDLQVAVHEDMKGNFAKYPHLWGLRAPDPSIDHRRVPNLMTFLARKGKLQNQGTPYLPGDIVAWRLPNGLLHIGIVAEPRTRAGHQLVVHNIGRGAQLEDVLYSFEELGHYRW
jgi:uncharacterized protein YijF (DUF1287 family)